MGRYSGIKGKLRWARDLAVMDRVEITLYGDAAAWAMYEDVTARHPKLKLVSIGSFGPSLVRLTGWNGSYLQGGAFADARRKARRAENGGYVVRPIRANAYREEILAINRSTPRRQGQAMKPESQTHEGIAESLGDRQGNGVFDREGRLRGYILWIDAGELIMLRGLMGHADSLRDGIMYLLFAETIRQAIEAAEQGSDARFMQYTLHHRQGDGMRRFKHELGFQPYLVAWRWRGERRSRMTGSMPSAA
ncbi:hypothetical protein [Emcibacter sp. SYSU 3D8]|uniref:hypothetical protein n=1 Tax=Emcibacter sp. SYSU 3D8 TaxID=3133969 RepID=UPI0031FE6990